MTPNVQISKPNIIGDQIEDAAESSSQRSKEADTTRETFIVGIQHQTTGRSFAVTTPANSVSQENRINYTNKLVPTTPKY